jgi:hypothetical protein
MVPIKADGMYLNFIPAPLQPLSLDDSQVFVSTIMGFLKVTKNINGAIMASKLFTERKSLILVMGDKIPEESLLPVILGELVRRYLHLEVLEFFAGPILKVLLYLSLWVCIFSNLIADGGEWLVIVVITQSGQLSFERRRKLIQQGRRTSTLGGFDA